VWLAAVARERVWLLVCACLWLYVTTRLVRWMDGYPAVDRDGCGRWRDVCGVVGGRAAQRVREMTAHACVCERECAGCVCFGGFRWLAVCIGVCVVSWGTDVCEVVCGAGWYGMVWMSPARHGLLCGCCDGEKARVVDGVCVRACGDTAGALDGYPAVDRDGCGRWRDVRGVVGARVVQGVREMTAHACVRV
jgi:hypothetical protein